MPQTSPPPPSTAPESTPPGSRVKFRVAAVLLACVLIAVGAGVWWSRSEPARQAAKRQAKLSEIHEAAQRYILSDKVPQARVIVQKLLEDYPDDAEGHVLMAKVLMAEGKGDQAYAEVSRSLELDPNRDQVQFLAGAMAENAGTLDRAKYHFAQASTLAPKNALYPMHLGGVMLKAGDLDGAQLQLLRARSLDASLTQVYAMLAEIAARQGKLNLALDQISKAVDQTPPKDPKWLAYVLQKSQLLRRANQPDAALALLVNLEPRIQQKPPVVEQLATCYLMLRKPNRAAAVWAELFALDPQNQNAAAEAGLCFVRAGDLEHARQYLKFAQQFGDANPKVQALTQALANPPAPVAAPARSKKAPAATRR